MAVKKTATLKMAPSQHLPRGHVGLHPNDGFDLGLMTKSHPVDWSIGIEGADFLKGANGTIVSAQIELLNQCPHQTLQLNMHEWKTAGAPEYAILLLDGKRMYLHPVKVSKKADDD
jgi:hypothetical protein